MIKAQVPMQGPYDQFLLFGDSLTERSCSQAEGFAFAPALQDGMSKVFSFRCKQAFIPVSFHCLCTSSVSDGPSHLLAFIRRLDVINRGFSVWHLFLRSSRTKLRL